MRPPWGEPAVITRKVSPAQRNNVFSPVYQDANWRGNWLEVDKEACIAPGDLVVTYRRCLGV